jgi:hypothetical protein
VSRTAIHLTVFPPSNPLNTERSSSKWSLGNFTLSAEGSKLAYAAGVLPLVLFRFVFSKSDSTERTLWTGLVFDSQQSQGSYSWPLPFTPTCTLSTCDRRVVHLVCIHCTHSRTHHLHHDGLSSS